MAGVCHVNCGENVGGAVGGGVFLLHDGDVVADLTLYVHLAVNVDGYGSLGVDGGTFVHHKVVDVAGIGFAAGAVSQNHVPNGTVLQGHVQGVVDLLIGNVVLSTDLVIVGGAGDKVVAGGIGVQHGAVLHTGAVVVEMVAVGGGNGAGDGGIVQRHVQVLELVVDVVPNVAGVFAVLQGGVGILHGGGGGIGGGLVTQVVDGERGVAGVARVVGLHQFHKGLAPLGVGGEVHLRVVEDHVGVAVVGCAGLDLYAGFAHGQNGVGNGDGAAGILLGHNANVAGGQFGVGVDGGGGGGSHDLNLVAAVEVYVVKAVADTGVGISNVAGAAGQIAVGDTVHGAGGVVFHAVLCHFHGAGAGHGVGNVKGVVAGLGVAGAGVRGQNAPAGGNDQRVGVDALTCAEDVGGANHAFKTQRKGSTLHHGNHEGIIFFLSILGLLGVDDGVHDPHDAVFLHGGGGADDTGGHNHGVVEGHVCGALGKNHGSGALEVVGTVTFAGDGHVTDVIVGRVHDDAVKEGAVGGQGAATERGGTICVHVTQQGGNGLVLHDAALIYPQGGTVGILGGLSRHVHKLAHLGIGVGAGGGFKGIGALAQHGAFFHVVKDVVLVAVYHQGQHAAVLSLYHGAVGQGHGGDVGGSGGAVDGVVRRGGGGHVARAVGDAFNGGAGYGLFRGRSFFGGSLGRCFGGDFLGGSLGRCFGGCVLGGSLGRCLCGSFGRCFCHGCVGRSGCIHGLTAGCKAQNHAQSQQNGQPFFHIHSPFISLRQQKYTPIFYHYRTQCQLGIPNGGIALYAISNHLGTENNDDKLKMCTGFRGCDGKLYFAYEGFLKNGVAFGIIIVLYILMMLKMAKGSVQRLCILPFS